MELNISLIQLFQILKEKLGDKEAEALVSFVDGKLRENNENNLRILATKEDLAKLEGKLDTEISDVKSEIIKWVFGFFVALMLAIAGLYFKK